MTQLPDELKDWLDAATFVVLATVNPDGTPQTSVLWAKRDGDDVLLSTVRGRVKERNLLHEPRVSLLVMDPADPYRYYEVRGATTMVDEGGDDLISELSFKYRGITPYPKIGPAEPRVVVRLSADRVVVYP